MLDNMPRGTICIEDLEVGMKRHLTKCITDEDISLFAQVSTDHNPVHLNEDYAQDTIFQGRIAHGMLTAGLISAVIGEQIPGHGTVYLSQNLTFLKPVRPGDTVTAIVEVMDINISKRRVSLNTWCEVDEKKSWMATLLFWHHPKNLIDHQFSIGFGLSSLCHSG